MISKFVEQERDVPLLKEKQRNMMMLSLDGGVGQVQIITPESLQGMIKAEVEKILNCLGIGTNVNPIDKCSGEYLDVKGAAKFLSKTPQAIRMMVHKNQLPVMKRYGRLYFKESDLIELLEDGRRLTPAELSANCVNALKVKKTK